ncbi:hypothetical protein ACFQ15_05750 [Sphingomonas hankookensis]|uniref:hypothetical protein n=1 Tax=Sphingomonas hankookensis TaxID=563996 RepID=UPI001F591EA9|nr:hypothetical protein [Sphingomonas hankookensis]
MAKIYGSAFSATDAKKLAPGTVHDAGSRRFRNTFQLGDAGVGGTTNTPIVARVREGSAVHAFELSSSANLSGINFTLGTVTEPAKYCAAFAGPVAGGTVRAPIKPEALAADSLALPEEIILTPSANLPGAGVLVGSVFASKR